eukprot:6213069-Pleurochrysis_carterae.AAC.3
MASCCMSSLMSAFLITAFRSAILQRQRVRSTDAALCEDDTYTPKDAHRLSDSRAPERATQQGRFWDLVREGGPGRSTVCRGDMTIEVEQMRWDSALAQSDYAHFFMSESNIAQQQQGKEKQ